MMRSKSRNGGKGFAPAWRKLWLALSFIGIILFPAAPARPEVDLTSSVQVIRGSTYFDYARNQTYLSISLKNVSTHTLQAPLRLVIESVSTARVTVANPDGTTTDGKPYLDFNSQLANGELAPGKTSAARNLRFNNPSRLRFTFTTKLAGEMVNTPPLLDAINSFSIDEGKTQDLVISASDAEGDALTFSVASLPAFAQFKDNRNGTATLSFAPGYQDAGDYAIGVSVTDGMLSSSAEAAITVRDANRSPRITSSPVTNAFEVTPYGYQVQAEDPDRDALRFSLTNAPEGMTIDPGTGLIFWNPVQMQIGVNDVTVAVSDGRGGADSQSYQVTVTATVDRTAPVVELVAPTQAQASTVLNIEAVAHDNVGITQVSFFVDGLHVEDKTVPPYRFAYNTPDEAGRTVTIRALAADTAGNEGEATARVAVVPLPDTTAPVIEAIPLPAAAAPGETVAVRAKVTDDRGIAAVRFSFQGNTFGSSTAPPYEAAFTVPASALPGSSLALDVAVEDTSQNLATAQVFLPVAQAKDVDPPTNVSLTAPTEAVSGMSILLSASALDNVGMMKIIFFADGVPFTEDPDAPYEATFTLPASKPVGSKVVLAAQAVDFAGNRTNSATVYALVIEARTGFLVGEVYDDTTGLPVPGAAVSVVVAGGKPPAEPVAATSDGRGRYRLPLAEGAAVLEISKAGYTSSWRMETVQPQAVTTALRARITPVAGGSPLTRLNGGTISLDNQKISLDVPAGALGEDVAVTLTRLGVQALPAPLPLGWSPVCVIHAGPGTATVNGTLQLAITGAENLGEGSRAGLNAASWDSRAHQWVRAQADALPSADGLSVTLRRLGTVALIKPDTSPAAPPPPAIGEAFKGVVPQAIPDGVTASILPSPKVLFMQPGAKSVVSAVLNNSQPLPSGTRLQVDFSEVYHKMDGTGLIPQGMTQDFALYQSATGLESSFAVSPSEMFDPTLLKEGVITLSAHRPAGTDGSGIVGPQGGIITSPGGLTLTVPPGALTAATPVSVMTISPADTGLEGDSRLLFLGGVALDFGDARLGVGAQLSVTLKTAPASDAQVLAVRPIRLEGATSFELVGIGTVSGSVVTVGQAANGLSLPGLLDGGSLYLVQMVEPVGYVTGSVQSGGIPLASGVVRQDSLPLVSIPWGAQAQYVLASPLGLVTVTAKSLTDGSKATDTVTLTTRDQIVPLDLALAASRPTVVSVSPPAGATGVAIATTVSVRFSQAMDPSTFSASSFSLRHGSTMVPGSVTLLGDKTTALFQPGAPLEDNTLFQVALAGIIKDSFGQPLSGNQADGSFVSTFTTMDMTPPAKPEAGQISMSMPDDSGIVAIRASQGTVEPGLVVWATNLTTGAITTVIAGDDGSFSLQLTAGIADKVQLSIQDKAGNTTSFSPGLFDSGDGNAAVSAEGGTVHLPDGSSFTFAPGSFAKPASVSIQRIEEAQSAVPIPKEFAMEFAAGLIIDTGQSELLQPLKFRIPTTKTYPADAKFLICKVEEVEGQKYLVAVETASYKDRAIEVNSPPWPGILGYFNWSQILLCYLQQSLAFVKGEVYTAPPIGVLTAAVQRKSASGEDTTVTVVANATPLAPGVEVQTIRILDPPSWSDLPDESHVLAENHWEQSLSYSTHINASDSELVGSWENYQFLGQNEKRWNAEAVFKFGGLNQTAETSTATEIVPELGSGDNELRVSTKHVFGSYDNPGAMNGGKPVQGAWVEIFNGLGTGYPSVARTSKEGRFVLAGSAGAIWDPNGPTTYVPNYIRVFDPLTGQGQQIRVTLPTSAFDYLNMGRIYIRDSLADGQPPTLDVQFSGEMVRYSPVNITVTATDKSGRIKWLTIEMLSQKPTLNETFSCSSPCTQNLVYTPNYPGVLEFHATAEDENGNRASRTTQVRIKDIYSSENEITGVSDISLRDGAADVDLDAAIYAKLETPPSQPPFPGGTDLSSLAGFSAYFEDASGKRIKAVGGTACGDNHIRIRPGNLMPPASDMTLVLTTGEGADADTVRVPFHTRGLDKGGILGGFNDIRGLATYGNYVYVADFADETNGIKIVDVADPATPRLVGGFPCMGARAVATDLHRLVVVGGGVNYTLPVLRLYSLENPLSPTKIGNAILFSIAGQVIPNSVRLNGNLAYVSTVGAGLQTVDLDTLKVIGGFRLPEPQFDPPLTGESFDSALAFPGLAVTGGVDNSLFVLSATEGGYLGLLPQEDGQPYFKLSHGLGIKRLAAASHFVIQKDLNGNGSTGYQNINLLAVSHGAGGVSLVDFSQPMRGELLSLTSTGSRVFGMEIIDGYLFTGDRIITMYDPSNPSISNPLTYTLANGSEYTLDTGGSVAVTSTVLPSENKRAVIMASSDTTFKNLQVGQLKLPLPGPDWDIIRTTSFETYINHPMEEDYLYHADPVNLYTGEFTQTETDLAVPGRGLSFSFARTYRSKNEFDGPMGFGWDHNYNTRVTVLPRDSASSPAKKPGDVIWYDGGGRADRFAHKVASDGGLSYTSPKGVFSELTKDGDRFYLTQSDGTVFCYRPSGRVPDSRYVLESITDRFGNAMTFEHDALDQLRKVRDSMGRYYYLGYNDEGRLISLTDFTGRVISYGYDLEHNLTSVTSPATADFPDGKKTQYHYHCGSPETDWQGQPLSERQLNHNLLTITDPKGQTYLENTYYMDPNDIRFDRVATQRLGVAPDGGTFLYDYSGSNNVVTSASATNRSGHTATYAYDTAGNLLTVVKQGILDGDDRVKEITSTFEYTDEGLIRSVTSPYPNGIKTEYTYNSEEKSRLRQGDMLTRTVTPRDGGVAREYKYTPGPFGVLTESTVPAGNNMDFVTTYDVDDKGLVKSIQYPIVTLSDGKVKRITESFTYGSRGELLSVTSGDGVVTRYEYLDGFDGPGYQKAVIQDSAVGGTGASREVEGDAFNLKNSITYDQFGNVETITDARGKVTMLQTNEQNQIVSIDDGRGKRTFAYDANDNLEVTSELGGLKIEHTYNSLDLTAQIRRSYNKSSGEQVICTNTFEYDASEHPSVNRTHYQHETRTTYDPRGLPAELSTAGGEAEVKGSLQKMTYDDLGNIRTSTDGEENSTSYEYNGFGELSAVVDPNGSRTAYERDPRGLITAERAYDKSGNLLKETTCELDELGRQRVVRETIFGGLDSSSPNDKPVAETRLLYDSAGRVLQVTDPLGRIHTFKYDGLGRTVVETDPVGNWQQTVYQGLDPITVIRHDVQPDGAQSETTTVAKFDKYGRLTEKTTALGTQDARTERFEYDERDNLTRSETVGADITFREYDPLNRLVKIWTGTEETNFEYDLEDRVIRQTDALGRQIQMEYDGRGRLITETYPDGTTSRRTFNLNNALKTLTDRAGNTFNYTYDPGNRLTRIDVSNVPGFEGTTSRTFSYDGLNRVVQAQATAGSNTFASGFVYNSQGDLLKSTQGISEIHGSYNLAGERSFLTYPGGSQLDTAMDPLGRVKSLASSGKTFAGYRFSGRDRVADGVFGNGVTAKIGLSPAREEKTRTYSLPGGQTQTGFTLDRDGAGRLSAVAYAHAGGRGDRYAYSGEGRLASVSYGLQDPLDQGSSDSSAQTASYEYDKAGNRLTFTRDGTALSYTSNLLNQYETVGTEDLEYNAKGNLHKDSQHTYAYDALGQLVRVRDAADTHDLVSYSYDAAGRRVNRTTSAGKET